MSKLNLKRIFNAVIPSYSYVISTAMSKNTIFKTMNDNIAWDGYFCGWVNEKGFSIRPRTKNRGGALIAIDATVRQDNEGSEISINMYVRAYFLFVAIICFFALIAVLYLVGAVLTFDLISLVYAVTYVALAIALCGIIRAIFNRQAKGAKEKLNDILFL